MVDPVYEELVKPLRALYQEGRLGEVDERIAIQESFDRIFRVCLQYAFTPPRVEIVLPDGRRLQEDFNGPYQVGKEIEVLLSGEMRILIKRKFKIGNILVPMPGYTILILADF